MANVLYYAWLAVQAVLALYVLQPLILLLIFGLKRAFRAVGGERKPAAPVEDRPRSFGIVVTAHKNLELIPPLVDSALKQTYPHFVVYVVADACEQTDIGITHPQVKVLVPATHLNAKIRSIDFAIQQFETEHDVIVILDADNLLHPSYLEVLNGHFAKGHRAVQTNMLAKNTDSAYACLDAAGNYFYNFIDRRMRMELGCSANIWGLGIAMELSLYKSIIYRNFLGGFDKKIQADIVKQIPLLAYAEDAKVYDEKIDSGEAMERQRTRWINAYFKYFAYGWDVFSTGLRRMSPNLIYFGINLLRPPLFMQIGAALLMVVVNFWVDPVLSIVWLAILAQFPITFFAIVAVMSRDKRIIASLVWLPAVFLRQVKAMFQIRKANKSFLQTSNSKRIYIEDVLRQ
ncbi:glycosyltransferase family 2 protein [Chitinophaga sp. NPDC101104]|uniref:glycosyltransferase family 2 protein n=1 Tax=Chitinophaga sp. NPDC101104 TaxID=3390561 RepID=UPI003D01C75B